MTSPLDATAEPRWIRDGLRAALGEIRSFLSTAYRFTRHPRCFARAWVEGTEPAMNPAAMLANAVAFAVAARVVAMALLKAADDGGGGMLDQVLETIGPHLHYAFLGLVAHAVLRVAGSKRRLSSSIGIALFAGAGPAWFGAMFTLAVGLIHDLVTHTAPDVAFTPLPRLSLGQMLPIGASVAVFVVFLGALCAGLKGVHGRRWVWSVLAVGVAVCASGLVFGAMPFAPGRYGPHLAIGTGLKMGGRVMRGVELVP